MPRVVTRQVCFERYLDTFLSECERAFAGFGEIKKHVCSNLNHEAESGKQYRLFWAKAFEFEDNANGKTEVIVIYIYGDNSVIIRGLHVKRGNTVLKRLPGE